MKKLLLATVSLIALGSLPALGADLEIIPIPPSGWSGPYAGLNAGVAFLRDDLTPLSPTMDESDTGFTGGVQLGWNFQNGNLLFGVEGDINILDVESSLASGINQFSADYDWWATLRARGGFLANDNSTLFYLTGGLAWTGLDMNGSVGLTTLTIGSQSKILTGWTVGGGVEHQFAPNWTAKAEYLYANFESESFVVGGTTFGVNPDLHVIRIGINRHF